RVRSPDRSRPAGDGAPQRRRVRAGVAAGSPRAPGCRAHRRARAAERPDASCPGPRGVPHRDAGHGRGLRRDQPPASTRHRRGSAACGPAARGVRAPSLPLALRPGRGSRRPVAGGLRVTATDRRDLVGRLGLGVLAAALRCVGLDGRGTWDADQGHDMLVLRSFVVDGVVPLLGPPTSIGPFHLGALYSALLPRAVWLWGSDPTGVTAFIALAGVGTVAATWWLARSIGGRC